MNMNANQIYMNMHKSALADMMEARVVLRIALEALELVSGAGYATLKSKKAAIKMVLEAEIASHPETISRALHHMGLVSTGANALRNAMQGFSCCALATTFSEFEEQCEYVTARGWIAMRALNNMISRCTAHAQHFRSGVQKKARARLPAVAVSKKDRKHAIAQHYAAWTDISTGEYIYWQPLQTSKYPFRAWCHALEIERMAKNWYVGSILGIDSSIHSGIRASSGGGEQYKLGHFAVKCPLR